MVVSCKGSTIITPNHFVITEGGSNILTCVSDITEFDVHWLWSGGRQRSVTEIYDGAVPESKKYKFEVSEHVEGNRRVSDFTIKNTTLSDGGTIYCRDDGGFGALHPIRIYSLKNDPNISHTYINNNTEICIHYCYWGEKSILIGWDIYNINYSYNRTDIEEYDEIDRCIKCSSCITYFQSGPLFINGEISMIDESSKNVMTYYTIPYISKETSSSSTIVFSHVYNNNSYFFRFLFVLLLILQFLP